MKLNARKTKDPDHSSITLDEVIKQTGKQLEELKKKDNELDQDLGVDDYDC